MEKVNINATVVLRNTIEAHQTGKYKIIIHEGGSRSSKTWSIFQFFILKALAGENFTLTIARSKLTWIKTTLLKDFETLLKQYEINVTPEINPNRPEQIYFLNGSEFAFFGLDYPQKLHGRKQDYFWINEAMEVDRKSFDQLEMRTTKGGIIDYNPSDDNHWVFGLQMRPDVTVIRSTMLDNPFLEPTIRRKILSYDPNNPENVRNGTADQYMWEVYGLGRKAKLKGVIFTNWDVVDDIPAGAKDLGLGLDFGFANDPTALVELYEYDKELYVNELIYERGLVNISPDSFSDSISKRMKTLNIGRREITADSAEPKSIAELFNEGFNITKAYHGPDSINYGINLLKSYKLHITRKSVNLENELRKYKWSEGKNGELLNEPVDAFNHAIDALRYRAMKVLGDKYEIKIYNRNEFLV